MTLCIAAMCQWNEDTPVVVAASDRMITVGDTEFEPPRTKIFELTNSMAMLIAGDTAILTEIAKRTNRRIQPMIDADVGWIFIEVAAGVVGSVVAQYRREMTSRMYLEPFGLTHESFLEKQQSLSADWVAETSNKILNYVPGIQCIVAGLDSSGAHIYSVDGFGRLTCHDLAGFAAIGSGSRHANSVMMFAGHTARNPLGDTLFNTFTAKRESEVSPGVGEGTDMFLVPQLGSLVYLPPEAFGTLNGFYNEMKTSVQDAKTRATAGMAEFLRREVDRAAAAAPPQEGEDIPAPPNDAAPAELAPPAAPVDRPPPPAPADDPLEADQDAEV